MAATGAPEGTVEFDAAEETEDGNGIYQIDGTPKASAAKKTTNSVGLNYTFGNTTAYAAYQTYKTETLSTNNKAYRYGAKYMVTPAFALTGVYSYLNNKDNAKTTLSSIGGEYALSKTVAVYGKYESVSDGAGILTSTEANGAADTALSTGTTATSAGFASSVANITRTRVIAGLRVGF